MRFCACGRWRDIGDELDERERQPCLGILRVGASSIWVMSEWGKESQTIVLFNVSARGTRKLTSAEISGC